MKDRTERRSHPGYCIRTKGKEVLWVTSAHGLHLETDPFFAIDFNTVESAQAELDWALRDGDLPKTYEYEIVEGWIPLCEQLRFDVAQLKEANKISPDDLWEIRFELESLLSRLDIWKDKK